ncbi:MAG: 5'/3'-nucleotidase SurE [Rikenellaceae bacterium]
MIYEDNKEHDVLKMEMKQHILITNDDGIASKGLRALINVASEFGDVTVVAPEQGMSGMSHSITMFNPLFVRKIKTSESATVYACDGTPVDCIKVAVDALMDELPTLILSGINHGANTNLSVIYSGTMGAATEGSTYKIPSLGFSHISHNTDRDMSGAMKYVRQIIQMTLENNTNPSICLNVNIPDLPFEEIKGIKYCRQTRGYWKEEFDRKQDPRGRDYFWLVGSFVNNEPDATDTDEWAIKNGYVAVVPVSTDMTDYDQLNRLKLW